MPSRLLFELFPRAAGAIRWTPLAELPTPLSEVPVDGRAMLVKRDDLTGEPYGGNKVRKLEFLLAAAQAAGATRVITAGAFGSHHALATTLYARSIGLDATVVMFPQRVNAHVRDIVLMCAGLGADIRFTRRMEGVPFALWRLRSEFGSHACVIPPGGSDANGTLGYVEAGLELAEQLTSLNVAPTRIHAAAGTLGTVAGLAMGLAIAGRAIDIQATRITSRLVANERSLRKLIDGALARLAPFSDRGLPASAAVAARIHISDDQMGEGYGLATQAGDDACTQFASAGLTLDTTYTAKAAAAFLADPLTADGRTLFIHTLSLAAPTAAIAHASLDMIPREISEKLERYSDTGEHQ